jgi:CBS domain-containing protein
MDHHTVDSAAAQTGRLAAFATVGEIMSSSLRTLTPDRPIADAVAVFNEFGFRHMPVVSESGTLVGVISDRDALRALAHGRGSETNVDSVMTAGGITVTPATTIADAVALVVFHRINCLPVTDGGALRGLVTTTDLLQALHQILLERRAG